jgi:hypothetical protein
LDQRGDTLALAVPFPGKVLKLISADVTLDLSNVGAKRAALVGDKPIRGLIHAVCYRNHVDRWALGVQRDGLSGSAIILETCRVKQRIGAVPAAGGSESACGVIGDVVADVGNRAEAIRTGDVVVGGAICQDGILEAGRT